jgi:hypothetical protein
VAKDRVVDAVDKRAADVEGKAAARWEMWARVEVEETAARDIILIWTLNGARARFLRMS